MKNRTFFLFAVFFATVALMVVQKPVFLTYYAEQTADTTLWEWLRVILNGLRLDLPVAGYVVALPLLLTLASLWISLSEGVWRAIFNTYFVSISIITAAIFAVDLALYEHWGFRIDGTILIYLADPKDAMASVDFWLGVRQTFIFGVYAALMIWVYRHVVSLFESRAVCLRPLWSLFLLLLGGGVFLVIRGGVGPSVTNISKVYFSGNQFLNHAAINPVFSALSTLGDNKDYAAAYPFFDETTRAAKFDELRGNTPSKERVEPVLNTSRPNVVLVILESFGRTVMDAQVDGLAIMPRMQQLKGEGIWFENFFANSFRTDRGEVAILNGFPAQIHTSIMKLPAKNRSLPSLARSLGGEGYTSSFTYGGDLNFTNQASYMYATGWQELLWQQNLRFDASPANWGYDDAVMTDFFADEVIAKSALGRPFLAGLLTLSSHVPFDVPYSKFDDKMLNAMAFSDDCIGRMIDKLKASSAWNNLLIVLVADHGYPYPSGIAYNIPLRHRIPMLWLGGAVAKPRVVEEYASQIDLCATLLSQLGISHEEYDYSKNIFDTAIPPRKFAYYTFNEGFGVVDAEGEVVWDATTNTVLSQTNPELLDVGRTMLQTTYVDIGQR